MGGIALNAAWNCVVKHEEHFSELSANQLRPGRGMSVVEVGQTGRESKDG